MYKFLWLLSLIQIFIIKINIVYPFAILRIEENWVPPDIYVWKKLKTRFYFWKKENINVYTGLSLMR